MIGKISRAIYARMTRRFGTRFYNFAHAFLNFSAHLHDPFRIPYRAEWRTGSARHFSFSRTRFGTRNEKNTRCFLNFPARFRDTLRAPYRIRTAPLPALFAYQETPFPAPLTYRFARQLCTDGDSFL
jgi:hypothetical protein